MIVLEWSGKNCVSGEEIPSSLSGGSNTRSVDSKRFFGLVLEPRPRRGGSAVIKRSDQLVGVVGFAAAAAAANFASRARWRVTRFINLTLRLSRFTF